MKNLNFLSKQPFSLGSNPITEAEWKQNGSTMKAQWLRFVSILVLVLTLGVGNAWGTDVYLTNAEIKEATAGNSYTSRSISSASGTWSGKCIINTNTGYVQINKNNSNYYLGSPTFAGGVTAVSIKTNNNTASGRTFYLRANTSTAQPTSGDYGSGSTGSSNGTASITVTGSPTSFYIYSNGAAYIESITVTYASSCNGTPLDVPDVTTVPASGQVQLSWPAVANASKYQVSWNGGAYADATSPYTKSSLTNGTSYTWKVKAIGNGSTYCDSEENEGSTKAGSPYTITWKVGTTTHATTKVANGDHLVLPESPTPCIDGKIFVGWSAATIAGTTNTKPTFVSSQTTINSNQTYYAVFATPTANSYTKGDINDLFPGQSVLLVNVTNTKALSKQEVSGQSDKRLQSVSVTISSNTISSMSNSNLIWTVENRGTKYNFKIGSNYLRATGTGNDKLSYNSGVDSWTLTANSGKYYMNSNNSTTSRIEYYSSYFTTYGTNSSGTQYEMTLFVPTCSGYFTTCCTSLGSINGSFSSTTPTSTTFTFGTTPGAESYQVKVVGSPNHNDWTTVTSPVTIDDLTAGQSYTAQFRAHDTNSSNCTEFSEATSFAFTTPLITASATITGLDYAEGGTCTAQSFTVSAVGLTAGVRVTAPTKFEVCKTQNGTYTSYVDLDATGDNAYNKTITNQTVWVRLASGKSIGSYNGNVTISGGSAANNTSVSLSGAVSSACTAPTITSQPTAVTCNLNETANLSVTATGTDVQYQWYVCDDGEKTNAAAIEGEDENSYSAPTSATGTKYYYCVAKSGACPTPSNVVAVTVRTPSLTVSKTAIAFGDKAIGSGSYQETFTVSGSNLAYNTGITISRSGSTKYAIDQSSIQQTAAGVVSPAVTITVTYTPDTKNAHNATLTISSTGAENKTISLSGAGRWQATFLDGEGNVHDTKLAADNHAPDKPATNPSSCDLSSTSFIGWTQSAWSGKKDQDYVDGLSGADKIIYTGVLPNMTDHMTYYPVFAHKDGNEPTVTTDELTYATIHGECSGNNSPYTDFGSISDESEAVYAGKIVKFATGTGCKDYIQMKSGDNNTGIVTTGSGGKAKKVTIAWNAQTNTERTVNVYGSTTAYTTASELYNEETDGDLLGTITWASTNPGTELTITGDYEYIGLRSASGALYLSSVSIDWASGGGYTYDNYMTTCCQDLAQVSGTVTCTSGTAATLSWDAVSGAESYKVKVPGSTSHNDWTTATSGVSVTGLTAGENYTAYFQAFDENGTNCPEGPESTTAFTTPKITIIGTPLNPMAYAEGQGPSIAQSFKVMAVGLSGNLTAAAPANFEICLTESETPSDWKSGENTLTITKANAEGDGQWVYVRMVSGLSANTAPSGNVTINGGNAAEVTVAVSGSVSTACENPTINTQPAASASYNLNVTATILSVAATKNGNGPALTYQWYWNSTNDNTTGTLISGAESSSYSPATSAAGTKYYYCVVSSGACSTPSNCAAITVNTPSVVVSESSIAFGAKKIGGSYEATFTVSGSNLANGAGIGLAITDGKFSIDKTSVSQTSAGAVSETTITVTYSPDAIGAHNATITISSTGVANKTLTLSGTGRYEDTYKTALHSGVTTWSSYATGVVMAGNGYNVPNPGDIAAGDREGDNCQGLHYHFAGWVTDANKEAGEISENIIPASGTKDADNTTYWAVWEKQTSTIEPGWYATALADLTSTDVFVLSNGSYAIQNVNGVNNNKATVPSVSSITVEDGQITSVVADNIKWKIGGNATDGYVFYSNANTNNYLYCNTTNTSGSNDNIRVGTTDNGRNTWKPNEAGKLYSEYVTNNTHYDRYLAIYNSADCRSYIDVNNGGVFIPQCFKYVGISYGDPKVECLACTATANAGTAAVDETGAFTTSSIAVKATGVNAGANCSLTDYGFVWSSSVSEPALVEATGDAASNCEKVQVGTNNEVTSFTGTLTGSFSAGNPIYVRSYAKNEKADGTYQYSDVLTITPRQVSFNMHNHGGDAPASQFVNTGSKVAVVSNPSEAGWIFNGWWNNDDYTGDAWDFASNTVSGDNVVLHAKWTAKQKYTITLNAGNGTVSAADWTQDGDVWKQEQEHGDAAITFPSANAGCAGWVFQGWKLGEAVTDASEFTADKNEGDELTPASNVTYYAVYRQNATGGTTYNKIESASALTTGDYLFVSYSGYAMKNDVDGTHMEEQGNGISNGASNTTSDATLVWTIIKFNNGKVAIKNGSNYLGINDGNNICLTTTPHLFTCAYNTTNSRWEFTSVSKTNYQLIYDSYFKIGTSQSTATLLYKQGAGMTGNYFTNPSCSDLTVTGVADPVAGGTVLLSAASAKAGDKVYAYYEVDDAYKFDNWSIEGTGSSLSSTSAQLTEITVGSVNTTVTANFTAKAAATVIFKNNGEVVDSRTWFEGQVPVAPALVNGTDGDACDETSDKLYGWTPATWVSTKEDLSDYTVYTLGAALPAIGAGDDGVTFTYNAIWAKGTVDELNPETKSQEFQYDTWTYGGSTSDKNTYRLFHTGGYVESAAFDRSRLSKVIVYGGTFGGGDFNSLTIGDGTNVWKNVTVSGTSQTGVNTYTDGTALSGVGTIRITSNSGTAEADKGVRVSKVEIYTTNYTYSKFRTACCTPLAITPDVDEEVGKHIEADKAVACAGEIVTISKTENGYFTFGAWNVTYVDGEEITQTIDVTNNQFEMPAYPVTISAYWNPKNYVATVNEPDASVGSVEVSGGSIDQGVRYVAYGSTLTVEATPADEDHYFSNWTITSESGSTSVSSNPLNYTMPGSNVTITANFGEVQYPALTVGTSENYTLVAKLANGDDIPDMGAIRSGTAIKVTFEPNGQYEVTEWSLNNGAFTDFDVDGNVISFNMPDVDVTVNVTARAYYELSLLTPENGSISEVVIADEAQSVASLYRVYAGNTISVTAVPTSSSFKFDEWQLDGTAASSELTTATATLTVGSENLSLKAIFAAKAEYTLTLKALGRTHATLNGLEGSSLYALISNAAAAPHISDQTFLGWSREEDNANLIISQSADLPMNGDCELYAVYQEKAHFYRKVTDDEALTDGQYLIVYEGGNVAFDGSRATLDASNNTIAVTIDEEKKIAVTDATTAAEFTITAKEDEGEYSILSASGLYIGQTSNANGMEVNEEDIYTNAIGIDEDEDADIIISSTHLRYNSSTGQERFRYFKSGSYSGQNAIQLYKRDAPGANKSVPTLTVANNQTVNADELYPDHQAGNIVVKAGGKLTSSAALAVNDLTINSEFAKSGQVTGSNVTVNGDIYLDIKLLGDGTGTMTTVESQQWYCISAPFDVNMNGGFYWGNGDQMEHNVDFQAFVYDGAKRASNGTSGWQRVGGKLEAGKAYLIGFDDERTNYKTIRLKAMTKDIPAADKLPTTGHTAAESKNSNWNGVGNPTLHYIALDGFTGKVQCYNNGSGYSPYDPTTHNYVVGTTLFMQATSNIDLKAAGNANYRAPKRVSEENENYSFCVEIAKEGATRCDNRLYVSTSDEATSSYEQGKDMLTMNGTSSKFAALIWTENYGMRLASEDVPMVNNQATYTMGIYAPANGTYTISTVEASEDADLYLTLDGAIIWNLSMGAYELSLNKGTTSGYGLLLQAKAPGVATGVDEIGSEKAGVQKIVLEDKVFILRGGKMYDVTGKAVR